MSLKNYTRGPVKYPNYLPAGIEMNAEPDGRRVVVVNMFSGYRRVRA